MFAGVAELPESRTARHVPDQDFAAGGAGHEVRTRIECKAGDPSGKLEHALPGPRIDHLCFDASGGREPAITAERDIGIEIRRIVQLRQQGSRGRAPHRYDRAAGIDRGHEPTVRGDRGAEVPRVLVSVPGSELAQADTAAGIPERHFPESDRKSTRPNSSHEWISRM